MVSYRMLEQSESRKYGGTRTVSHILERVEESAYGISRETFTLDVETRRTRNGTTYLLASTNQPDWWSRQILAELAADPLAPTLFGSGEEVEHLTVVDLDDIGTALVGIWAAPEDIVGAIWRK